jgi:hypothetical protein
MLSLLAASLLVRFAGSSVKVAILCCRRWRRQHRSVVRWFLVAGGGYPDTHHGGATVCPEEVGAEGEFNLPRLHRVRGLAGVGPAGELGFGDKASRRDGGGDRCKSPVFGKDQGVPAGQGPPRRIGRGQGSTIGPGFAWLADGTEAGPQTPVADGTVVNQGSELLLPPRAVASALVGVCHSESAARPSR